MEPDSPAAPQDFGIHHWAEEMVQGTKLIKFTGRYQNILWFLETVGSQVAFKGKYWICKALEMRIWWNQHFQLFATVQNLTSEAVWG